MSIFGYMSLARKNVGDSFPALWDLVHSFSSVPTLVEMNLRLSEVEVQRGSLSGTVSALTEGLAIEKSQ